MTERRKRKENASDTFFNVYHRVPDGVKKYTDPLVKTGIRTERTFKPYMVKGKSMGEVWIDKNIVGNFNKHITSRVNRARNVVPFINGKPKKKK
jgi:hypothetical protein